MCNRCRNYSHCGRSHNYGWSGCWDRPQPCPCPYPSPYPYYPYPTGGVVGGYTAFAVPTAAQIQVFNQAVGGLVGATYTPLYVATQTVAGTNYLFIAQQTITTGGQSTTSLVLVKVFQGLDGSVQLVNIQPFKY